MDSDLADAVEGLKAIFAKRKNRDAIAFGKAPAETIEALKKQLRIPSRIRGFLLAAANPLPGRGRSRPRGADPAHPCGRAHQGADGGDPSARKGDPAPLDWNWPAWVIIGESSLLGDPYFLDTSKPDPEGDCPVYTAMSGQERWVPTLAASSFAQFLRILSTAMEIAAGFGDAIMDDEDEDSFREALEFRRVKVIDAAALRGWALDVRRADG